MGHQETPARETFHPTWLSVKVAKKRGESLDTSKACSAKGTRTFCLHHPQEGEEEDQEGEDQEEEEPTPQTMIDDNDRRHRRERREACSARTSNRPE